MAGFQAEYAGGDPRPDGIEIEKVAWFNRNALPAELPRPWSITYRLLQEWRGTVSTFYFERENEDESP